MNQRKLSLHCRFAFIGDSGVGKTALLYTHFSNNFQDEYNPNCFLGTPCNFMYEGHNILLDIMEVNNDEAVMKLLPITFVDIDVFIICFSLVCQNSFSNIKNYWIEKINKYCPGRPIILVGTKCDLRDKEDNIKSEMIQTNQIEEMKDQIGALKYIECSAKERHNLNEVMTSALDIVVSEDYESPQDAYKRLHPKKCYIS